MPTVQDFLCRVLPWPKNGDPGVANLHWFAAKKGGHNILNGRPFTNPDEFAGVVKWADGAPHVKDVYFCTSIQSKVGKEIHGHPTALRLGQNAVALKSVWLDIDVKAPPKGYATITEAVAALTQFVQANALPSPSVIVGSGGGLHVYWTFDQPLSVNEWRPYAEGLKAAAIAFGLRCDAGITTDAARLMRVPETHNFKSDPPKEVKILAWGKDYPLGDLSKIKGGIITAAVTKSPPVFDLSAFQPKPIVPFAGGLLSEVRIHISDNPPLELKPIAAGCPFFYDALKTGGADHSEPLWNLTVLASTFMENGEKVARGLGCGHKDYSKETTAIRYERKLRERDEKGLGWPSCASFEANGSKFCALCKYKGRLKSPLNLAGMLTKTLIPAPPPVNLMLPPSYVVDAKTGYIVHVTEKVVLGGVPVPEHYPLFRCALSQPWVEEGTEGGDIIHFKTTTSKGVIKEVSLPMEALATAADMQRCLLKQTVKIHTRNAEMTREFFMAWLTKMHDAARAMKANPFGWYINKGEREGFVYGGVIFNKDGTEHPSGFGDASIRKQYEPTGQLQPWFDACKVVTDQKRPELNCIVATAFAGPLMFVTGEYGGHVSVWGDSGANKSSAMKIAMAVWGNPQTAMESIKTSEKSAEHKMGELKHIPLLWDEIKDVDMQKKVYGTVFTAAQGVGGGKLRQNRTQYDKGSWQTCLVTCSNLNFVEYVATQQTTTDAGVNRVFEYFVAKPPEVRPGAMPVFKASQIVQELQTNYGQMGLAYAKLLGSDPDGVWKIVNKIQEDFHAKVKCGMSERFWAAMAVTILAGAHFAKKLGVDFDIPAMEAFLLKAFFSMRAKVEGLNLKGGTTDNTEAILGQFLKEFTDTTLHTDVMPGKAGRYQKVNVLHRPRFDDKAIQVQAAVSQCRIRISKAALRDYLIERKHSSTQVFHGLKEHLGMTQAKAVLGGGTTFAKMQEHLIEIPVPPGSVLEPFLHAYTAEKDLPESMTKEEEVTAPVTDSFVQAEKDLKLVRELTPKP